MPKASSIYSTISEYSISMAALSQVRTVYTRKNLSYLSVFKNCFLFKFKTISTVNDNLNIVLGSLPGIKHVL